LYDHVKALQKRAENNPEPDALKKSINQLKTHLDKLNKHLQELLEKKPD
jgi:acyl carrier protein phosphodiesterase